MTAYADHMTIAQIIHDFATTRGDLTDRGARDDLAAILERRVAAEKAGVWDEAGGFAADLRDEIECDCLTCMREANPYRTDTTEEA